ncbi:MAG: Fic family protein [Candidatus Thiodiazotropha sp. (ex Epidulcina cf. delphinae)]|nr:Fic family protein [Candidatus Thiodiazotropha sp. (ex Epidulcina cf. delphinae)]
MATLRESIIVLNYPQILLKSLKNKLGITHSSEMDKVEAEQLAKYTPCNFVNRSDVIKALAEVHVELILIHPFREGNGRCARILASIMALQADLPVLDFSLISEAKKMDYFAAVQTGMDCNYEPMERLFAEIIESSILSLL